MEIFKKHYLLILILAFSAILLTKNLDKPFVGHHDWNSAWHGMAARNMDRYGLLKVRFASVISPKETEPEDFIYFTHYPPLVPIFVYLSIELFGIHNWSIRIVPVIFSLLTILMVYILTNKVFNNQTAVIAASITSLFPILIYFGRIPTHDLISIPFVLTSIFLYFKFFEISTKKNFILLLISLVLSHLVHWSGYYVTPLFFFHYLLFSKNKRKVLIALAFPTFSLLMFSQHLLHLIWLTGNPFGGGLLAILKSRLNLDQKPLNYTELSYIKQEALLLSVYFTRPVLVLSSIGLISSLAAIFQRKASKKEILIIMLAAIGTLPIAIFRNLAFIHDFIILSFLPFFAVGSAVGIVKIFEKLKPKIALQVLIVFLVLVWIFFERAQFTHTLLSGTPFEPGRILGQIINQKTQKNEVTLILSPDFKTHFEVHTTYYADRFIVFWQEPLETLEKDLIAQKFQLIVASPNRDTAQAYMDVLQKYYKHSKIGEFELFEPE